MEDVINSWIRDTHEFLKNEPPRNLTIPQSMCIQEPMDFYPSIVSGITSGGRESMPENKDSKIESPFKPVFIVYCYSSGTNKYLD